MSPLEILQQKRAFNVSEAAQYACVSRGTVEYWLMKGLLPYEELPGKGEKQRFRRIRKKDIDAFLDGNLKVNRARSGQPAQEKQSGVFLMPKTA